MLSGAIFTTLADGSAVYANSCASKTRFTWIGGLVRVRRRRQPASMTVAVCFQPTDPSEKKLLSTDAAKCRPFDVANGIITNVGQQY